MLLRFALIACFICALFSNGFTIDPGTAQGKASLNGQAVDLSHAYALLHDNKEGLLDGPRELRILLSDREIDQGFLSGLAPERRFSHEAESRNVSGIFMRINMGNHAVTSMTILSPHGAWAISLSPMPKVNSLKTINNRASGSIECGSTGGGQPGGTLFACDRLRFSAPLFHEPPVTADIKGSNLGTSPQVRLLREHLRAMKAGNAQEARKFLTVRAQEEFDAFCSASGLSAAASMGKRADEGEKSLKTARRLVRRGNNAVLVFTNNRWVGFTLEGGKWKIDRF